MIITLAGDRMMVALGGKRITEFDPTSPKVPARQEWFEPQREPNRPIAGYIGL